MFPNQRSTELSDLGTMNRILVCALFISIFDRLKGSIISSIIGIDNFEMMRMNKSLSLNQVFLKPRVPLLQSIGCSDCRDTTRRMIYNDLSYKYVISLSKPSCKMETKESIVIGSIEPARNDMGSCKMLTADTQTSWQYLLVFLAGCLARFAFAKLYDYLTSWLERRCKAFVSSVEKRAAFLLKEERYEECISALKRSKVILEFMGQSVKQVDLVALKHLLAKVLILNHQPVDAEKLLAEVCHLYEQELDRENQIYADALEDLGKALGAQIGKENEAISVLRRCVGMHDVKEEEDISQNLSNVIEQLQCFTESPIMIRKQRWSNDENAPSPILSPLKSDTHEGQCFSPIIESTSVSPKRVLSPSLTRLHMMIDDLLDRIGHRSSPNSVAQV